MIDILFIDGTEDKIDKTYSSFLGFLFPLASLLELNDYTFKILNVSFIDDYSFKGVLKELQRVQFRCIGFTTSSDNYLNVRNLSHRIKEHYPSVPILLGGPQVSYNEDFVFNECNCDVIIRHEGDYKLIQILDFYIRHKGSLQLIDGISYRIDGKIFKNKDTAKYIDLDTLPTPQYAIISDTKYWLLPLSKTSEEIDSFFQVIRYINNVIITSRGCPYNCIFCVEGSLTRSYRERSLDLAIKDIEYFLQVTKLNNIVIADSTFTSSPKRVREFCKRIKELRKRYNFKWYAEGRANILAKNPELIDIMHDAGLWNLQIGIESGNDEILKIQNKKITLDEVRTVARKVGSYNDLVLSGNIILGNPGETIDTFKDTVEFAKELNVLSNFNLDLKYGYLVPYVGTPIRANPQKYGVDILVENFENEKIFGYTYVLCKPKELSMAEIENLYTIMGGELKRFYLKSLFKLPKKDIDEKIAFYKELQKMKIYTFPSSFYFVINAYIALFRYYNLFERKDIIKNISNIKQRTAAVYPIRLWELFFDSEEKCYCFTTLKGETFKLKGKDKYLWEMASGINTIDEIINYNAAYFNGKEEEKYAIDFYINLYENYALLFRE